MRRLMRGLGLGRESLLLFSILVTMGASEGLWYFLMPIHARDLGAKPEQVGLTLSSAGLAILISFLPIGMLADRYSHRRLLIALALWGGIATALMAFANSWQALMVFRFLYFISWASYPIANSYIASAFLKQDHNRIYSTVHAGFNIGVVLFPAVGAWIAVKLGIRVVFVSSALLLLGQIVPIYLLRGLEPNVHEKGSERWSPFQNRTHWQLGPFILLLMLALNIGVALVPNYLSEIAGLDLLTIGRLGTVQATGAALLTLALGRLRGRTGLTLAPLCMVLGLLLLLLLPHGPYLAMGMLLLGSLESTFPLVSVIQARIAPSQETGTAFGVQGFIMGLALVLGPVLAGLLYGLSPRLPLVLPIAVLPLMALWARRMRIGSD